MECEYDKRKKCDSLYIERYNKLVKENEELKSIIKIKDEGIKAFTEELCDTTLELERLNNKVEELMTLYTTEREVKEDYKSIIKEAIEYIETLNKLERELGGTVRLDRVKLENILKGEE